MADKTHGEYVEKVRARAVELAAKMLRDDEALLERASEMNALLHELQLEDREGPHSPSSSDDMTIFVVVDSETDELSLGVAPERLAPSYRDRVQEEKVRLVRSYREALRRGCVEVLRRYAGGELSDLPKD